MPMLPVVAGDAETRPADPALHAACSRRSASRPGALGFAGPLYGGVAARDRRHHAGAGLAACVSERRPAERAAKQLFAFSILYLFLLFATLLVERGWAG